MKNYKSPGYLDALATKVASRKAVSNPSVSNDSSSGDVDQKLKKKLLLQKLLKSSGFSDASMDNSDLVDQDPEESGDDDNAKMMMEMERIKREKKIREQLQNM